MMETFAVYPSIIGLGYPGTALATETSISFGDVTGKFELTLHFRSRRLLPGKNGTILGTRGGIGH